jgi:hypothetical protein
MLAIKAVGSQHVINVSSSISRHMQNQVNVVGGQTNGPHQVKSSLNFVHHPF